MSIETDNPYSIAKCPICGGIAESGHLYGGDKGALRWLAGEASWGKNITTGFGDGITVGQWGLLKGPHAQGIRCAHCRRIILSYGEEV